MCTHLKDVHSWVHLIGIYLTGVCRGRVYVCVCVMGMYLMGIYLIGGDAQKPGTDKI
jgi:hypothetical protein